MLATLNLRPPVARAWWLTDAHAILNLASVSHGRASRAICTTARHVSPRALAPRHRSRSLLRAGSLPPPASRVVLHAPLLAIAARDAGSHGLVPGPGARAQSPRARARRSPPAAPRSTRWHLHARGTARLSVSGSGRSATTPPRGAGATRRARSGPTARGRQRNATQQREHSACGAAGRRSHLGATCARSHSARRAPPRQRTRARAGRAPGCDTASPAPSPGGLLAEVRKAKRKIKKPHPRTSTSKKKRCSWNATEQTQDNKARALGECHWRDVEHTWHA